MAPILRFSALAAFISAVTGYAIGEFPTRTVGYGSPFMSEPTEAPSMELMKRSLQKRDLINTCTEWTIAGGGQPECSNSGTCLFTAATDGYLYEGCGETSIAYNWITECWPYPQIGTAPVSQIYCPAEAPSCGFLAFQFDELNTYYNFGCSTVSYSLYVDLIASTDAGASQTLVLAGGGTSSITDTAPVTVTDFEGSGTSTSVAPIVIPGGIGTGTATTTKAAGGATATQGSSSSSTNLPSIGSHTKKSTPIGPIVGGVVGGIAVIAFIAFLVWFFLRKSRQDAAANKAHETQVQQQQADAATATALHNHHRVSEIGGTTKPTPEGVGAFAPVTYTGQENGANGNEKLMGQQVNEYPSPSPQSPPPVYAQPAPQTQAPPTSPTPVFAQAIQHPHQQQPTSPYPPSNYTELENQNLQPGSGRTSVQPVSPVGTYDSSTMGGSNVGTYQQVPSPQPMQQQVYQHPPNAQEMSGNTTIYQQVPSQPVMQQQAYQHKQNVQEMSSNTAMYQQVPSPPMMQQAYQPPPNVQEMSANGGVYQQVPSPVPQQQVYQPPPNVQEMSGNAASVGPVRQSDAFDMSGAPMSESYGHHEMA